MLYHFGELGAEEGPMESTAKWPLNFSICHCIHPSPMHSHFWPVIFKDGTVNCLVWSQFVELKSSFTSSNWNVFIQLQLQLQSSRLHHFISHAAVQIHVMQLASRAAAVCLLACFHTSAPPALALPSGMQTYSLLVSFLHGSCFLWVCFQHEDHGSWLMLIWKLLSDSRKFFVLPQLQNRL